MQESAAEHEDETFSGSSEHSDRPDVLPQTSEFNDEEIEPATDDPYSLRVYDLDRYLRKHASNVDDKKLHRMIFYNTKRMMKESLYWCLSAITEPTAALIERGASESIKLTNMEQYINEFRGNDKYKIRMMITPTKCRGVYELNVKNLRDKVHSPLQKALRLLQERMTASPSERLRLDMVSNRDEKSFEKTTKEIGKKVGTFGKRVNTLISQFEGTIKKLKQFHHVKAETDGLLEATDGPRSMINICLI